MTTLSLDKIEKLEFEAVDKLSRMPETHPQRAKLHGALIDLRVAKRKMLAADPSILRKSSTNPSGRRDLPANDIAVKTMVSEARDRQANERHPNDDEMAAIKSVLRRPMVGDAALVKFLARDR